MPATMTAPFAATDPSPPQPSHALTALLFALAPGLGHAAVPGDPAPPTVVVAPRVRSAPAPGGAADRGRGSLPPQAIADPLHPSLVLGPEIVHRAARVTAGPAGRQLIGPGDRILVQPPRGPDGGVAQPDIGAREWLVLRAGRSLQDPDTGQRLGLEMHVIGRARRVLGPNGDGAGTAGLMTLEIMAAPQELQVGDRLIPAP